MSKNKIRNPLGESPEPPEETDPGWKQWKEDNYVFFPWTREVHNMGCDCERHGQPAHKISQEQASGLLDTVPHSPSVGDCFDWREFFKEMDGEQ